MTNLLILAFFHRLALDPGRVGSRVQGLPRPWGPGSLSSACGPLSGADYDLQYLPALCQRLTLSGGEPTREGEHEPM